MTCKTLITAFGSIFAASSALASQAPAGDGAPQAPETALYCMKVEAVTGTRLETVECWTRTEWADREVDVDAEWAKEGVRVVG